MGDPAAEGPRSSRLARCRPNGGSSVDASAAAASGPWKTTRSVRQSLQILLTGWGCEVVLAASAAEALRAASREAAAPDLLLLDHRLPDGSGPELVAGAVPQVGVGGAGRRAVRGARPRTAGEGAGERLGFLAKPVNPSKLRAAVTHMLMRSAASA